MFKTNKSVLEISCKDQKTATQIQNIIFGSSETILSYKWNNRIFTQDNELQFEVIEMENDEYFDFINVFLDILEEKFDIIANLGVTRSDITIWHYGKYVNQCSIEFSPERMKRIGDSGITLCLSFMDTSGNDYAEIGGVKIKKDDWF